MKDTFVVNAIVTYDLNCTLIDAIEHTSYIRKSDLRVNESELLDFSVFKNPGKENPKGTPGQQAGTPWPAKYYLQRDADAIRKFYDQVFVYQSFIGFYISTAASQRKRATQLLKTIQEHYHSD